MRAAFLAHSARRGDAIGRQLAAKLLAVQAGGWQTRLFVEDSTLLQDELAAVTTCHTAASLWQTPADRAYLLEADCCFVEFGSAFDLLNLLPLLAGKKPRLIFSYYGLTPLALWEESDRARLEAAHRLAGYVWFADAALANSSFAAEELQRHTGYPRERIHLLPCLIAPPVTHTCPAALRPQLGVENARVLLFVGRMAVNKRPRLLIEVMARLRDLPQPVHAVFLGPQQDVYATETARCQQLAADRGVSQQVHFLGAVSEADLWGWYHTADALVLPALHEGFGMPAIEAMACGLPVVVAKAAALPETVGAGGISFAPQDLEELERQLRRLLTPSHQTQDHAAQRLALVSPRFGKGFAGGAETSLRMMAKALAQSGHKVEVFTTCNRHDSRWENHLSAGTTQEEGLTVHRFPIDAYDLEQHVAACETITQRRGEVLPETEEKFLRNSLHSTALVQALMVRQQDFAAVITGPYLFGLTAQVARALGEKVLLAPCFHDEPTAYLQAFQQAYRQVGGLLFHSVAEQQLAAAKLGYHHPNAVVVGTLLPTVVGNAARGREKCGANYLVYCGRYCAEKGLPQLLEYFTRYQAEHPERYRLVCLGHGALRLPKVPGILDLGFVSEETKRDVLAGARALVLLSPNESLSLVMLEAWLQGTPVIGTKKGAVVVDQLQRSGGGFAIGAYAEFRETLDRLWQEPELGQQAGEAGRRFALRHYADPAAYTARLEQALTQMRMPLPKLLCQQGRLRAQQFLAAAWQPQFWLLLKQLATQPRLPVRRQTKVHVALQAKAARPGEKCLLSLRLENIGTVPLMPTGPQCCRVWSVVYDAQGKMCGKPHATTLPGILLPGKTQAFVVEVQAPEQVGEYRICFRAGGRKASLGKRGDGMKLMVQETITGSPDTLGDAFLQAAQAAVQQAHERQQLPQDYLDVTEGAFAPLKRFLKRKLLHNFRKAYVDVLSRQQSEANEALVTALCHLLDGFSVLSRKVTELEEMRQELRRSRRRERRLRQRLTGHKTPVGQVELLYRKDAQP
jgi:glycosyltransferase involved in cell wall biosynthesis